MTRSQRYGIASCMVLAGVAIMGGPAPAEEKGGAGETTVSVGGTVVGPDGKPAAGAGVFYSLREGAGWGRVVAEGKTDDEGRFRLEAPADEGYGDGTAPKAGAIWAYRPGLLMASQAAGRGLSPKGLPTKLVLGPPAHAVFEVKGPDGRPVAGATVAPRVLLRDNLSVPDGLAEKVAAETATDADGRAVLTAFFPEEVHTVIVTASGFGAQQFGFAHRDIPLDAKVLTLLPAGTLKGRLVGGAAEVRGRRIQVAVRNPTRPPSPAAALFHLTTDEAGRFEVPELAVGEVWISDPGDITSPDYFRADDRPKVEEGKTTRVEIPLKKGVTVKGVVVERGTDKPVAGVKVGLGNDGGPTATTDERGRYRGYAPPGTAQIIVRDTVITS